MKNNYQNREDFIIQVLSDGLTRAASSFTKIINKRVHISVDSPVSLKDTRFNYKERGEDFLYVMTTQLIGSIHGKSFLILSQQGFNEMTKAIGDKHNQELKEGFLLEIDNIISATVISEISNELAKEVYGDVPKLFSVKANDLQNFIHTHTLDYSGLVFQSELRIEGNESKVQFTWVLDSKIMELVPNEKLVA